MGLMTDTISAELNPVRMNRSEYHVDMWRSVQRRWMVGGVLAALALAVMAPKMGAQGGALHAQYLWYLPLSYIYFSAGRRRGVCGVGGRLLLVSCAHSALMAPALAVLLLAGTQRTEVHYTLVQGMLVSSVGSGCGWLSLAMCGEASAAPVSAACYLVSLLTTPLAMILLCGRAVLPSPGTTLGSCLATLAAFGAGAVAAKWGGEGQGQERREGGQGARLCALALLYMQCCDALQTRGSVRVEDMFAVLLLELSWLGMSVCACWGYARVGLLQPREAHLVAICALPRAPHTEWQGSLVCGGAALAQLPAVLLAPAQALLLAAIAPTATPHFQL